MVERILLVLILALVLLILGFIVYARIENNSPTYKVGTVVYYRDPLELKAGKIKKVLKNDIIEYMVETNEKDYLILKESEILGEYGKVNFN